VTIAMTCRPTDLASVTSAIERSQIVLLRVSTRRTVARVVRRFELPAGFEDIDRAILDWIAAEALASRCDYLLL